ncbi:MAG: cation:proton antiporter [Flavisolibacter sp.]
MDILTIITILIFISAGFSYLNERFIKLPSTIGVVTISVTVSFLILIAGKTNSGLSKMIITLAHSIDFTKVLLDVMLGFLLFASALHFDYQKLKENKLPVFILSTLGVVVSTAVYGLLFHLVSKILHFDISLAYCFLFGALISPTDPVAVASILKQSKIPPRLHTIISGESLFNDGLGLVLFVILLEIVNQPGADFSLLNILQLFAQEVLGGVTIGLIMGYIGYRMMRSIKNYQTIFLISIAVVLGVSVVAGRLHASIPLSAVTAGLIIGNKSLDKRNVGNQFLARIWQLLDEVLNTILFVMIGLQLAAMPFLNNYWQTGLLCIIIILIARAISVTMPAIVLLRKLSVGNVAILTWAGLRGGISIAMALSLPPSAAKEIVLSSCYIVVIFSIIVQGLTLNKVVKKATE